METRATGKRTLAVRLGPTGTRVEYTLLVLIAYLTPLALRQPWFWLPYVSLPLAAWLLHKVWTTEGRPLNQALKRTGQLHLVFGLLFAASLWLA